jgi:hypothetical protein
LARKRLLGKPGALVGFKAQLAQAVIAVGREHAEKIELEAKRKRIALENELLAKHAKRLGVPVEDQRALALALASEWEEDRLRHKGAKRPKRAKEAKEPKEPKEWDLGDYLAREELYLRKPGAPRKAKRARPQGRKPGRPRKSK